MIVISDTTPLISLMKIGHLDLIHSLFGEIFIPQAVFDELTSNNLFSDERNQIEENPYIHLESVSDYQAVEELRRTSGLDVGESESIVLTEEKKAAFLLMDELKGRAVATQKNIQIMGTIGILMIAINENLLSREEIISCIDMLKNTGRHISDKLYNQLMSRIIEN